jgi:helicase
MVSNQSCGWTLTGDTISIDELDIPRVVKEIFASNGIHSLWPPQSQAVRAGILGEGSMVVSAPTSSGKTLIAELMFTKHLLSSPGKAIYLVPLRALASQKQEELQKWEKAGLRTVSSTGDFDRFDRWLSNYDLIIQTYEKCDSILRHRDQADWLKDVSVVIADEVHLVGDQNRGPTLEVVLTRLKRMNPETRFLALSATISNARDIASWLGAKLVVSNWRPVPLYQGVYYDSNIYFEDGRLAALNHEVEREEPVVSLCLDTVKGGGQALVFASTRRQAVSTAKKFLGKISLDPREKAVVQKLASRVSEADDATPLTEELSKLLRTGVGFHHAGLPFSARTVVEQAFKNRSIKVLVSTTTLAAGLNLPARRVVVYDLTRYEFGLGRQRLPVLEYHQMAGRAGRPGLDSYGEAVLIAKRRDEIHELFEEYVHSEPETLEPNLTDEKTMLPHVLSTVASGYAVDEQGLLNFFLETFSGKLVSKYLISKSLNKALEFLLSNGFIAEYGQTLLPTPFGKKSSDLYLHPVTALLIAEAKKYEPDVESDSHFLHLICLPLEVPKPRVSQTERDELSIELDEVEKELPVSLESYADTVSEFSLDPYEDYINAWKGAKVLEAWCNEMSEANIEQSLGVQPGDLYQLYTSAAWVARGVSSLLQTLGANRKIVSAYSTYSLRIESGIKKELVPLVSLRGIGRVRARMLYKMGIKTLADVAKAPVEKLTQLRGVTPSLALGIKEEASKRASTDQST